jgi:predicted amidohydrolase YtcJ
MAQNPDRREYSYGARHDSENVHDLQVEATSTDADRVFPGGPIVLTTIQTHIALRNQARAAVDRADQLLERIRQEVRRDAW